MYTFALILAMIAVVLSPIAIDWFLNVREARAERRAWRARQKKGPQLVWAAPRR